MRLSNLSLLVLTGCAITTSCSTDDDFLATHTGQAAALQVVKAPAAIGGEESTFEVSPYFYEQLLFINHRGLTEYPENTFAALNAAVLSGFLAIECDICMTRDSVFVLQHDATIDRCSDGTGRVNDMTYEELLAYDFGSWKSEEFAGERIARLDDVLDYFKELGLIIELDLADENRFKREWIPALYELVKEKGMLGQTMFTATREEFAAFLSVPRDIIVSISGITRKSYATRALPLRDMVTLCNFSVPKNNLTQDLIDYAHENGIKVKTWTTTTPEENLMYMNMGVDYIITEVPAEETNVIITSIPQIYV